ncbi:DgyrCDS8451 [Dimorphilus gyrociliatus]|uniref:DgyrCDS8451 n=1 Tax=Dimorphilus gyrociliatus TaxID=2664684 RepID=A0A7I8VV71_9ANNE|nr:DgyrCDS8451 [Dimorphilus gyrociliatus]
MEEFREMNPDLEDKKTRSFFKFPIKGLRERTGGRRRENRLKDTAKITVELKKEIPPGYELAWVRTSTGIRYLELVPSEKIPIRKKIGEARSRSRNYIDDSAIRNRKLTGDNEASV